MAEESTNAAPAASETAHDTPTEPEPAVQTTLRRLLDRASVEAVYGKPVTHEGTIVIPAAEMLTMIGFGFGSAKIGEPGADRAGRSDTGSGAGGGGYILGRPVATIVVTPHSVHQLPIVDVTKIALAAFTAMGVVGPLLLRLLRAGSDRE
jgi:uncharacterized spore protein YtfJ